MNTTPTRLVTLVATLTLGVTVLSGCTDSAASPTSNDGSTATSQVLPYDADEATATREAMEADAYAQAETSFRELSDMTPNRDEPLPNEASRYATKRWIGKSNDSREFLYADGRYSEGETTVETVTPVSYVQQGNPGWSMTVDFCVRSERTLFEKDGTVSETELATPDGEPLKPGEASTAIITVDYLHNDGTWRANASETSAADSC